MNLTVYVVWEPMLGGKRGDALEAMRLIDDPRVTHYWNDEFLAGEHFRAANYGRIAWDIYYLFGPEAVWQSLPNPILSSGATVYHTRSQLQRDLDDLLNDN